MNLSQVVFTCALALGAPVLHAAGEFAVLHQFTTAEGSYPNPLIQGADGHYYGTALTGGAFGFYGDVFRMTSTGAVTVLHSFRGSDGDRPRGTLVNGDDGYFYGTTSAGGGKGGGTAFRIKPAGSMEILHHFDGLATTGSAPQCITAGNDGNFYGVAMFGGTNDKGTVFRLTRAGVVTAIAAFNGANGEMPSNCLTHTGDGNFYGVTGNGGANNKGVAFKVARTGGLMAIHSFGGAAAAGTAPSGPLEQGTDGFLYGTTTYGGTHAHGTFYRISKAGAVTWLYSFTGGADGGYPKSGVTLANNFALYGATTTGGAHGNGTTFKASTLGAMTTLHSLTSGQGIASKKMLLDKAGKLIGTTSTVSGGGAAYRQNP